MGSPTMDTIFEVSELLAKATTAAALTLGSRCYACTADTTNAVSTEINNPHYIRRAMGACVSTESGPIDLEEGSLVDPKYNTNSNSFCTDEAERKIRKQGQPRVLKFETNNDDEDTFTALQDQEEIPPPKTPSLSKSRRELPRIARYFDDQTTDDDTYGTCGDSSFDDDSSFLASSHAERTDDGSQTADTYDDAFNFDSIGKNIIGIMTNVVTSKSSWNSNDVSDSVLKSPVNSNDEGNKNSRDDDGGFAQSDSINDFFTKKHRGAATMLQPPGGGGSNGSMKRELPSFGKSREFRSFGSKGSHDKKVEDQKASVNAFKPTFIPPDQKLALEVENNRYNFITQSTNSSCTEWSITDKSSVATSATASVYEFASLTENGMAIISVLPRGNSNDDPQEDTFGVPLLYEDNGTTTVIEYSSLSKTPSVVSSTTSTSTLSKGAFSSKIMVRGLNGKGKLNSFPFFKKSYDQVAD